MTWTRKELKMQAKEALQRNYWRIVLVSFLVFCYGFAGGRSGFSNQNSASGNTAAEVTVNEDSSVPEDTAVHESSPHIEAIEPNTVSEDTGQQPASIIVPEKARMVGITIFILIAIAVLVFLYILALLLILPFEVGISRFMVKSIDDTAQVKEITYAFDHSYKNVVKAMFHYDIRVFLWYLLFIIPGIYKQYQYRMVPYILAEHPDMDYREVLKKSSDLMKGNKWKAFLLDLSFVPWHILGIMTCGIVEIFYAAPYCCLAKAALYRRLSLPEAPAPLPEAPRILLSDTQQI